MNEEVKVKWIEALKSGQYEQGKRRLRTGDKFCCLGVLCDLHAIETGRAWEEEKYRGAYLGKTDYLPSEVKEWAELISNDPMVGVGHDQVNLSIINDNGKTFEEIANIIEKDL